MNRELLSRAIGGISDRYVAEAMRCGPEEASLRERSKGMKKRHLRRAAIAALAAALLLAMGITAYAAGWLDSIFGQAAAKINTNDASEDRLEAAAAAVSESPQEPEAVPVDIPGLDGSSLTLKESWYDGQGVLLGVDLESVTPDPVVGYEPDEALLERITQPAGAYQFYYSTQEDLDRLRQFIRENASDPAELDEQMKQLDAQEALLSAGDPDDLDNCLAAGTISREMYDERMRARTERGAAAGLHYESAICLDAMLQKELTGEEYDRFWELLRANGAVCVVMQDVYIGDHMLAEDTVDLAGMQTAVEGGTFVEGQSAAAGKGYLTAELPEELRDLDELHIQLKVKGGPVYYYMQLEGRAYALHEQGEEQYVSFTIPNSAR